MLTGKHIVVGITGGIAAYKIPLLIRLLVKAEAEVRVVMTPAATDFVTPLTLSVLSRNEVLRQPFDPETGTWNSHVELGRWADLMLFAPVTASTLGKMTHGIADNYLMTVFLSAKCPVMIAPSMDLDMFNHPSTQQNLKILNSIGITVIEPRVGELASGLSGPGRMEEPDELFDRIRHFFFPPDNLNGKRILVTAGPTCEPIDAVRFISNRSSGKMGFAIAEEAAARGARVTLITGPVNQSLSDTTITRINVQTASEMLNACLDNAGKTDILIMTAAVADYSIADPALNKMKKKSESLTLSLVPTPDILLELSKQKKPNQIFVGFALETDQELVHARDKMERKSLDIIVMNSLNDPGAGFNSATNKVTILTKNGLIREGTTKPKREVASDILSILAQYDQNRTL